MLGILTLAGLVFARFATASTLLAAAMFLAYGAARALSIGIDGQPDGGMVTAMIAELAIGAASLAALVSARKIADQARQQPVSPMSGPAVLHALLADSASETRKQTLMSHWFLLLCSATLIAYAAIAGVFHGLLRFHHALV
jgi:hypothetical protein